MKGFRRETRCFTSEIHGEITKSTRVSGTMNQDGMREDKCIR